MASASAISIRTGPTPPGLPSPPTGDFFDDNQWTVLLALLDAIIPSITATSNVKDDGEAWSRWMCSSWMIRHA